MSPERVRREALRWTLGLQVFVVAASMAATFAANSTWAHMDAFLGHTYTGLVGITGTVLGYYFGRGGQE